MVNYTQDTAELAEFIDILVEENVGKFLEIGLRYGDTLYKIAKAIPGVELYGVELPEGPWGREDSLGKLRETEERLREENHKITLFIGDSRSSEIIEGVRDHAPFDCILIDADHSEVETDWNNYKDMAPMIAFHDIAARNPFAYWKENGIRHKKDMKVPAFWKDIKEQFRHKEIVHSEMGIGVLWR